MIIHLVGVQHYRVCGNLNVPSTQEDRSLPFDGLRGYREIGGIDWQIRLPVA